MESSREITKEIVLPAEASPRQLLGGRVVRTMLGVACAAVVVTLIAIHGDDQRALRSLPAAERDQLYARTLQNLNTVCATEEAALRDFCEEQARLLKALPECDDACYRLADKQLFRVQSPR